MEIFELESKALLVFQSAGLFDIELAALVDAQIAYPLSGLIPTHAAILFQYLRTFGFQ